MKAKSCLRSSKIQVNPEQLAAVNKTTYSRNKIDLEKVNQANNGYDRKKRFFQKVRTISYARGFLNMFMVVGLLF